MDLLSAVLPSVVYLRTNAEICADSAAKFSSKFLEDRQPRLQRFLRTVMLHPEMGRGGPDSVLAQWITLRESG